MSWKPRAAPAVRVRGRVDRLERDGAGRLVVVDVKTGKTPVSKDDAQRHAQLAMYQLAIAEGLLPQGDSPGGGRLVYLGRTGAAGPTEREQNALTPDVRDDWREVVRQSRGGYEGAAVRGTHQRRLRALPGEAELPRPGGGRRNSDIVTPRYSPAELASALGLFAPTDEQAAVIAAPPGPLVVIAGAGAGKTETMAARVVWLVANGYASPGEVLGLTFTRKAAGQLLRRVRTRLARLAGAGIVPGGLDAADDPATVSTYHAFAGMLLREHGLLLPVEPDTRLLSETELWQLAFRVVTRASRRTEHRQDTGRRHLDGAAAGRSAGRASRRHRAAARHPRRAGAAGAHAARWSISARPRSQPVAASDAGHPDRTHRAGAR